MNVRTCNQFAITLSLVALTLTLAPLLHSQAQPSATTLKGTVSETTLLSNNNLHVWLQAEGTGSEVCLGPEGFLADQGLVPAVGDRIEVTGVRVGNGSLLVANSLEFRGKALNLRRAQPAQAQGSPCANGGCGCGSCGSGGCGHHGGHHGYGHCCDHE